MEVEVLKNLQERLDRICRELSEIEAYVSDELHGAEHAAPAGRLVSSDLLMMPDPLRAVLVEVQCQERATATRLAEALRLSPELVETQLQLLVDQGHVTRVGGTEPALYCIQMGNTRPARLPLDIWNALEQRIDLAAVDA